MISLQKIRKYLNNEIQSNGTEENVTEDEVNDLAQYIRECLILEEEVSGELYHNIEECDIYGLMDASDDPKMYQLWNRIQGFDED